MMMTGRAVIISLFFISILAAETARAPDRPFLIEDRGFLIQEGRVGRIQIGMRVLDMVKLYPAWSIQGGFVWGEGIPSPVIEIRLRKGQKEPSLAIALAESEDHRSTIVSGIHVRDPRFHTQSGIRPGSTIGYLRTRIGDLTIHEIEGQITMNSRLLQMSFEIPEATPSLADKDGQFKPIADLPGHVRTLSVWVYKAAAPKN